MANTAQILLADLEEQLLQSELLINELKSFENLDTSMETLVKVQDIQKELHILITKVNAHALDQIDSIIRKEKGQPRAQKNGQQVEQQHKQQVEQQHKQEVEQQHKQPVEQQHNEVEVEPQEEQQHEELDNITTTVEQLENLNIEPTEDQQVDPQNDLQDEPQNDPQNDPQDIPQDDPPDNPQPNELQSQLKHSICTVQICHEIQEQIASMGTIHHLHFQDYQEHILLKEQLRLLLLADLDTIESLHLQQMEQIHQEFNAKLEENEKMIGFLKSEQAKLQHRWKDAACSICLEQWNSTSSHRLISLPCGHLFGDQCIRTYLMSSTTCPQCRSPASSHGLRYIYGCAP